MANTTADKLALLQATKANLKAALAEKGQTVGDVFSTYPAAVRAIETGGNEWILYSGVTVFAPPSSEYSQITIPVDDTIKGLLLYIDYSDGVNILRNRQYLFPQDQPKDAGFSDGQNVGYMTYPFATNTNGGSGYIIVQNKKVIFYVVEETVPYLYYMYLK